MDRQTSARSTTADAEFVVCASGHLELREPDRLGRWIATRDPVEVRQ